MSDFSITPIGHDLQMPTIDSILDDAGDRILAYHETQPGVPIPEAVEKTLNTLREIDLAILKMKRNIGASLSNIISGTGTVLDYLRITGLIALATIEALVLASGQQWAVWARMVMSTIKQVIATILDSIGFQLLVSTHELLLTLWADYREVFSQLSNAASGISAALGYNAEFLPALLYNIQNLYSAGAALLGVPAEESQIRFVVPYADFLSKWDTNFDTYAKDPGAILDDINQWVTEEALRTQSESAGIIHEQLTTVSDIVNEKAVELNNLVSAFDSLITGLPSEQFEQIQSWWEPINETIEQYRDEYIVPSINYLNEITEEIDRRSRESDITIDQFRALLAGIPDMLTGVFADNSDLGIYRQGLFNRLVANALGFGESSTESDIANKLANISPRIDLVRGTIDREDIVIDPFLGTTKELPQPPNMGTILSAISSAPSGSQDNILITAAKGLL